MNKDKTAEGILSTSMCILHHLQYLFILIQPTKFFQPIYVTHVPSVLYIISNDMKYDILKVLPNFMLLTDSKGVSSTEGKRISTM